MSNNDDLQKIRELYEFAYDTEQLSTFSREEIRDELAKCGLDPEVLTATVRARARSMMADAKLRAAKISRNALLERLADFRDKASESVAPEGGQVFARGRENVTKEDIKRLSEDKAMLEEFTRREDDEVQS